LQKENEDVKKKKRESQWQIQGSGPQTANEETSTKENERVAQAQFK
jgi:hypothetical protein